MEEQTAESEIASMTAVDQMYSTDHVFSLLNDFGDAAKILLVLHTREIRRLFSELYARVSNFYRDAIEWYMRSRSSRFFSSFSEKMKDRYVKAARISSIPLRRCIESRALLNPLS